MEIDIKKLLIKDEDAFYINKYNKKKLRGVKRYYEDTLRNDKAKEQSQLEAKPKEDVLDAINELFYFIKYGKSDIKPSYKEDSIILDEKECKIIGDCIIASNLKWELPTWDKEKNKYVSWDKKYNLIKEKFDLSSENSIVWIKFTKKGSVGVVAKSFDINWNKNNSSYILVNEVGDSWDESIVFIFPITQQILEKKFNLGEIELMVGNYLIEKNIPIIDFYSHNN